MKPVEHCPVAERLGFKPVVWVDRRLAGKPPWGHHARGSLRGPSGLGSNEPSRWEGARPARPSRRRTARPHPAKVDALAGLISKDGAPPSLWLSWYPVRVDPASRSSTRPTERHPARSAPLVGNSVRFFSCPIRF